MDIQKILHTVPRMSKRKQMGFDKRMIHPVREWLLGLLCFFIVIIIGGVVSTYTFLSYTNIVVTEAKISQSHSIYNQTLAQNALKLYQSRKDAFSVLKNTENSTLPILFDISSSTPAIIPPTLEANNTIATSTKTDVSVEGSQLVN